MKNLTCIEDLRALARRKVPRAFFEYADSGSYNEETFRANRADLETIKLRQRVLVDVSQRSMATTIIGQKVSAPLALAPIGLLGMQHGNGEVLAAQAADAAGIPFTLSTMSIGSIEDVAEATGKPFWFQLYVIRDREFSKDILARAAAAKCNALVLTVDLQVLGQRHRDIKNGMTVPLEIRLKNVIDVATKPAWAWSILTGKRKTFGNLAGHVKGMEDVNSLGQWTNDQFDPALNWKDVEWIKKTWPGKLIIKGILDVDDARMAAKLGADAIVVSNHGGRQLDGAPSSISMLPSDRRRGRQRHRGAVRRRHPHRRRRVARAGAGRARLHDRPRLCLRSRRRRRARRRPRDRDSEERTRRRHGADRHQQHQGHRPPGAGGWRSEEEAGGAADTRAEGYNASITVVAGLDPALHEAVHGKCIT